MNPWTLAPLQLVDGALAGFPRCCGCGSAGYQGDKYCACCGVPFTPLCSHCGAAILQPLANYCTQCGKGLASRDTMAR